MVLEDAVIASIKHDRPVYFGCDVFQSSSFSLGILDNNLYNIRAAYGFTFNMTKDDYSPCIRVDDNLICIKGNNKTKNVIHSKKQIGIP